MLIVLILLLMFQILYLKTRVKPPVQALISGNDTICDNKEATIDVYFNGTPPYTFTYAVNGVNHTL